MSFPARPLAPGEFYKHRRIVGLLGSGGMGTVYRVEHPRLVPRERALKILHQEVWLPPRWEVNAAGRLGSHPNIVQTLEAGHDTDTGTYYHEMELLEGHTLEQLVQSGGPLGSADTLRLLGGVASALDAAHQQQLVHCDLKPSNLLVTASETSVKVLDFGIAEALWETTSQGPRGTLLYMAREQVTGEPLVPQTDLWALALVCHYMLSGSRYWTRRDHAGLRAEILAGPAERPSAQLGELGLVPRVREAYDAWFFRCLELEPRQRFASAEQTIQALRGVLGHREPGLEPGAGARPALEARMAAAFLQTAVAPITEQLQSGPRSATARSSETPPTAEERPALATPAEARRLLVCDFFPKAVDVARVADDLATTSAHYLLRPPDNQAAFEKQLDWFSSSIRAYNDVRRAYAERGGAYAGMLGSLFGYVDDALHAAARETAACSAAFRLEYPLPSCDSAVDVRVQHTALCADWQRVRVVLGSSLRQSRRALDRLEALVEGQARAGALEVPSHPDASGEAVRLLREYGQSAHELADSIEGRFLGAGFDDPALVAERLWEVAPCITKLNRTFIELSNQSLWLRVLLLQGGTPEWRSEQKLASALGAVSGLQWDRICPQLNTVLVPVISFLLGVSDASWLVPVRDQELDWRRLVATLREVDMPRAAG